MRRNRLTSLFVLLLALTAAAFADEISGTVNNGTTGKPAGGVTVTLVDPLGGMAEVATAKANAQGQFKFNAPAANGPRLVRAERGGVNYFKMLPPGINTVELSVYDAASSVEGISGTADVLRLEAESGTLTAEEMFVLTNSSQPPRTLSGEKTFEFVLPDGAKIDGSRAQAPNGQPISVDPKPTSEQNHYAFAFALKPGETKLQVNYHVPYSGQASISPQLTRDFEHFVVITPVGIKFTPKDPKSFQGMDAQQPGTNVQVSMQARKGQDIAYAISGTGTYPADAAESASAGGASANGRDETARPGGGLGRPIDAPDALAKYRWYILAALMAVLIGGGIWTHERSLVEAAASGGGSAPVPQAQAPVRSTPPAKSERAAAAQSQPLIPGNPLLAALKDEIFALEVEHQQGKLSQAEYEKARAALEQTLQRALSRAQR
jgi:hypothetical protein